MIAVKLRNLTKKFDLVTAVNNINLDIEKGKINGFIGPDGAGKTTLLRLIAGLFKPTHGSVEVEGIDVVRNPLKVKECIGYMPQHFSLYGDLTVSENLKFFADMYQIQDEKFKAREKELLDFSQLYPFKTRLAKNLSGGMQKKLALACNLFHTPEILLLDEPTTGVDPISRKELWNLLFQLNNQGTTILFTTPYMDEAQKCHQVGLIYEGKILTYQSPQRLIQEMQDEIFELTTDQEKARNVLKPLPEVKNIYPFGETLHLVLEEGSGRPEKIKQVLDRQRIKIHSIKKIIPSFEDVFIALIQEQIGTQE